jgi:hypothetical protein
MFVGKARSLPRSGVPKRCFNLVGSSLTCKHQTLTRLEKLDREKHYFISNIVINYGGKKLITLGLGIESSTFEILPHIAAFLCFSFRSIPFRFINELFLSSQKSQLLS